MLSRPERKKRLKGFSTYFRRGIFPLAIRFAQQGTSPIAPTACQTPLTADLKLCTLSFILHPTPPVDTLTRKIRDILFASRASRDAPITEQKLADRFQFSRTPIRDALRVLEEEGLIERRKRRGSICAGPRSRNLRKSMKSGLFWKGLQGAWLSETQLATTSRNFGPGLGSSPEHGNEEISSGRKAPTSRSTTRSSNWPAIPCWKT